MKLKIEHYDIDIKAKDTMFRDRNNLMDTINFLNYLSIYCSEAARAYESQGYHTLAKTANTFSDDIYETLKKMGVYKEC